MKDTSQFAFKLKLKIPKNSALSTPKFKSPTKESIHARLYSKIEVVFAPDYTLSQET